VAIRGLNKYFFLFTCGFYNNATLKMKFMAFIISFFTINKNNPLYIAEAVSEGITDAFKEMGYHYNKESNP